MLILQRLNIYEMHLDFVIRDKIIQNKLEISEYLYIYVGFYLFQQLKDELGEVVAELEALDGQEECKQNSKAKQMSIGRKKFNMDPKKGKQKTE